MRMPSQLIPDPLLRQAYRLYEARILQKLDRNNFPQHVAVIMDGHRRYARTEGLQTYQDSYRVGMDKLMELLRWSSELDIPAVTGWLLSTDNLSRPAEELDPYFDVLIEMFERLPAIATQLGYEVRFIGSLDLLPDRLSLSAKQAQELTESSERRLTIAVGYGGRQEIVDACRELVAEIAEHASPEEIAGQITADAIAKHLYAADLPDPDLVVRTSGESRLSGFLLWQAAYSEYSFVDVFWPEFRRVDFLRTLRDYSMRERRFGQ